MRVGCNLIVKEGNAYQSHFWEYYRPIGSIKRALEALTRYEVDEINIICLDYQAKQEFNKSIDTILESFCPTPIIFGGGINPFNYKKVLNILPSERFSFCSSILKEEFDFISKIRDRLGNQAIIGVMPLRKTREYLEIFCPRDKKFIRLTKEIVSKFVEYADEVLIYDIENDGSKKNFNFDLLEDLKIERNRLIISGGITKKSVKLARKIGLSAVYIDNSMLHVENGRLVL